MPTTELTTPTTSTRRAAAAACVVAAVLAAAPAASAAVPGTAPTAAAVTASVAAPAPDAGDARRRRAAPRADAIAAHYRQLGGRRSFLGRPLGPRTAVAGGQVQHYTGGAIFWSAATGAWEAHGALLQHYLELGGPAGPLGFPVTDEHRTPDGLGSYNHFARAASLYWSPGTGAHAVQGAVRDRWAALGWEGGVLGYPVTDELGTPDRVGRHNHFSRGGSVYWSPATGAHAVLGAIRARWAALGWEGGLLGYPVTDELGTPDRIGRYNHFSRGGSVYWTPATGAHAVLGAVRAHWGALGAESGLGYPVTDELASGDTVGRFSVFSHGASVYWSPATGAWSVRGAVRDRWLSVGAERGALGYPVSDEHPVPGGQRSDFTGGSITWSAQDGSTTVVPLPTPPAAVTDLVATPGDGSADLDFTAPADGGSPITGWERSVDGGAWLPLAVTAGTGAARSATVDGLTDGVTVALAVRARNAKGAGAASAAVRVTPAAAVHAPDVDTLTAAPGDASAALELHVGAGSAPTGFEVSVDGAAFTSLEATADLVRTGWYVATVSGLANGQEHSLVVHALVGSTAGADSDATTVTPVPAPTAPTAVEDLAATAGTGAGEVQLTFRLSGDGGSPVTGYAYRVGDGAWAPLDVTADGDGRTATVSGLAPGGTYTVQVQVTNAVGSSTSNPAQVTLGAPAGTPGRITDLRGTPGDASAHLVFSAPGDAAGLTYSWSPDGESWLPLTVQEVADQPGLLAATVTGLRNDVPVTIVVRAEDGGLAGQPSNAVLLTPASGCSC